MYNHMFPPGQTSKQPNSVPVPTHRSSTETTDDIDLNDPSIQELLRKALELPSDLSSEQPSMQESGVAPSLQCTTAVDDQSTNNDNPPLTTSQLEGENGSSWHMQNPGRPVLLVHIRTPLTSAQKVTLKISADERRHKEALLSAVVKKLDEECNQWIVDIANEHSVTVKKVSKLLTGCTSYRKTCDAALNNALVWAKAMEVNEYHPRGSKYMLQQLQQMVANDPKLQNLNDDAKEQLKEQLWHHWEEKGISICATNIAATKDVQSMLDHIFQELDGLALRMGTYKTLFVMHGHSYDMHSVTWYGMDNAMDFWEDVMELQADYIAEQFELWGCSQNKNITQWDSLESMQCQCTNYFIPCVKLKHGINKKGWPEGIPFRSPYNIGNVEQVCKL
ncbi:hypothetical protein ID866_9624 [Astraeus odoratus]|nr:hypothetical protein ID866_9624 [Astraeus odoratus]